jgi:hypothetical protein
MKYINSYKLFEGEILLYDDNKVKAFADEIGYIWSQNSRREYIEALPDSYRTQKHMMFFKDFSVHSLPTINDNCSYSLLTFSCDDIILTYLGCETQDMCLFSPDGKFMDKIVKYKIITKLYRVEEDSPGYTIAKEVESFKPYSDEIRKRMDNEDISKIPSSWHITGDFYKNGNLKWINLKLSGNYIFIERTKISELLSLMKDSDYKYHKY